MYLSFSHPQLGGAGLNLCTYGNNCARTVLEHLIKKEAGDGPGPAAD